MKYTPPNCSSRGRMDLQGSQEDASFPGMTGGIVEMTKKICHPEPGFTKAFHIQENRVKYLIRNLFENGL